MPEGTEIGADMINKARASEVGASTVPQKPRFEPKDITQLRPQRNLPDELWLAVLECSCTFPPEIFGIVMLNLVKNPNITSSHLFRADIFYDSDRDNLFHPGTGAEQFRGLAKHMKPEYQPRRSEWPGFTLERTIVRQLIPRNPQLDKSLLQTCHFFRKEKDNGDEENLVLYIPHIGDLEAMPFYHPVVKELAFLHTHRCSDISSITLLYRLFPADSGDVTLKLKRTALRLLQTIHKHGQGQLSGYLKRVHHDQIIPQKAYQDTYTRLKTKYGRLLSEQWVEVTDPGKHVFEDLGIAAFLIELWKGIYRSGRTPAEGSKPTFPGFVDIGCGNGILVHVLLCEGYPGWGFDARQRKTWSTFPQSTRQHLQQRVLVPSIFRPADPAVATASSNQEGQGQQPQQYHDGIFPVGTFIVSNHADELTTWTPLLAYLNYSSFITIPCCSHDLSGARFRAAAPRTRVTAHDSSSAMTRAQYEQPRSVADNTTSSRHAAETGSLNACSAGPKNKAPSAYSTLCSYVASLAAELGYCPEHEVLRIPSTRNSCIVARARRRGEEGGDEEEESATHRRRRVEELVARELKKDIATAAREWTARAEKLSSKPGSGH